MRPGPPSSRAPETADRLGIDERSGGQRRAQILIGLADAVDDDAVGREAGADGERQLDGTHDLGAEAIGGKTPKERGIGIRLDGVRHERTGQCGGPGSAARRRGVEIGDVEGRSQRSAASTSSSVIERIVACSVDGHPFIPQHPRSVPSLRSRSISGRLTIAAFVLAVLLGSAPSQTAAKDPTPPPVPAKESRLDQPSGAAVDQQTAAIELAATGFQQTVVFSGLDAPTAVEFASDGRVFVAEKPGVIQEFSSLTDTAPSEWADFSDEVHDYWDRGLLGMALDPSFTSNGRVYVAYSYNDAGWPDGNCPEPPGGTSDGCVIHGRVSALTVDGSGLHEQVLVEDWCQQFPSHSMSDIVFDSEGALIVNGGDGASFDDADWGQFGGAQPGTPTPRNPCGDPPGGVGGAMNPPSAEGGSLRSQDWRTTSDPVALNGAVIRINRFTGAAMPDNPTKTGSANMKRIVAYGLRNPFRMAVQPSTQDVWIGDVGWQTWEEINRVDPDGTAVPNFGWPCHEGADPAFVPAGYGVLGLCQSLGTAWKKPHFTYRQNQEVVTGDGCGGGGTITGLTFYNSGPYPDQYNGALFFTDYTRQCLWVMPTTNGVPDPSRRDRVLTLANPVQLTTGPGGDIFYVDIGGGTIRRISFIGTNNHPPTAVIHASDTTVSVGDTVNFNANGSSDPDEPALLRLGPRR